VSCFLREWDRGVNGPAPRGAEKDALGIGGL